MRGYLEAGRIGELDEALLEQIRSARAATASRHSGTSRLRRVMRALLAGRLAEAEALSDEAAQLAERPVH